MSPLPDESLVAAVVIGLISLVAVAYCIVLVCLWPRKPPGNDKTP